MIKIRNNRRIALLLVLAMLATMFVSVGTASAATVNKVVGAVPTIAGTGNHDLAKISIEADEVENIASGNTLVLTLPSGVEWQNPTAVTFSGEITATFDRVNSKVVNVTVTNNPVDEESTLVITPKVNITKVGTGDLEVNLAAPGTAIAEGDYTLGVFSGKGGNVSALSTPGVGDGDVTLGTIRLIEKTADSIANGETVTVKLPTGMTWDAPASFVGTNGRAVTVTGDGERTATLTFGAPAATIGIYDFDTPVTIDSDDAAQGDVIVSIGGTADISADVTIGKYQDYGATVSIDSVKDIKAGKFDQKTDKITIEEDIPGTLLTSRTLDVKVPSWVKITDLSDFEGTDFAVVEPTPDGEKSKVSFEIVNNTDGGDAGKISFKLELSVQGDKTGDIEATISGAGLEEQKLVIAKAVAPASLSTSSSDLKIGVQNQKLNDIVITEGIKEGILKTYIDKMDGHTQTDGQITVNLTEGVTFSSTPTVTVSKGNLEVDKDDIALNDDKDQLIIPIKSESTNVSEITISDIEVTLDRTVPEGAIYAKLGGSAIVENFKAQDASDLQGGEFDCTTIQKVEIGKVTTPAPDNTLVNEASFVIGSSTYTLNGKEVTAVAPSYAKNNRTYLSIRDVAHVLGIVDANILWDQANQSVTLMKGDKVVQLKLNSNIIIINGAAVSMDVTVEASNDRTFLPAAWVANAFGATATWDAATNTVNIK